MKSDRIMVEKEEKYIEKVKNRGKRKEKYFVKNKEEVMDEKIGVRKEEIEEIKRENVLRIL